MSVTPGPAVPAPAPLPEHLGRAWASGRTLVMGVLNVTPDSFSDGGRWDTPEAATAHGLALAAAGADIIDVGGESTRPGSRRLTAEEDTARVLPVVRALVSEGLTVSVDTIHASTAAAVTAAGALIVNDVSGGLADPGMHRVVADTGVVYVCQHWRGSPETMDQLTTYPDGVLAGVEAELAERLAGLDAAGVARSQVVLDPGLGFAKTHDQSWQLLAATARLTQDMGLPVLVGASRKRFLALAVEAATPATSATSATPSSPATGGPRAADPVSRDAVTAAITALAAAAGAWAVRVHDVRASRDAAATAALWKEHR